MVDKILPARARTFEAGGIFCVLAVFLFKKDYKTPKANDRPISSQYAGLLPFEEGGVPRENERGRE